MGLEAHNHIFLSIRDGIASEKNSHLRMNDREVTFTYETEGKRQVLLNNFQKNGMAGGHDKN